MHFKLGDCYGFLLNDLPSAIREYDRAITIKPDFITAYLHKAGTYNSMGKFDLAEKTLRRALEMDESSIEVYLELVFGKVFNEGDVKKVQDALENQELNQKLLVDIHFTLGKIYSV